MQDSENIPDKNELKSNGNNAIIDWIGQAVNPPLKEVGLLLVDQVRFWRYKNQVKIITKAKQYLDDKNIKPNKVPIKILAPLLDQSSLEEEDSLQERWVALLTNTLSQKNSDYSSIYSSILSELNSYEVAILDYLFKDVRDNPKSSINYPLLGSYRSISVIGLDLDREFNMLEFEIFVYNLKRLNLIDLEPELMQLSRSAGLGRYEKNKSITNNDLRNISGFDFGKIRLSLLGWEFIRKCTLTDDENVRSR